MDLIVTTQDLESQGRLKQAWVAYGVRADSDTLVFNVRGLNRICYYMYHTQDPDNPQRVEYHLSTDLDKGSQVVYNHPAKIQSAEGDDEILALIDKVFKVTLC